MHWFGMSRAHVTDDSGPHSEPDPFPRGSVPPWHGVRRDESVGLSGRQPGSASARVVPEASRGLKRLGTGRLQEEATLESGAVESVEGLRLCCACLPGSQGDEDVPHFATVA